MELIVACDKNGVIGTAENTIPWYLPEDLARFKLLTTDGVVVMGRKTFESLPIGGLKNRVNIILTKNYLNYTYSPHIFTDMAHIMPILQQYSNKTIFIIGGSDIYKLFIQYCKIIHLTLVHIETPVTDNSNIKFPYHIPQHFNNAELYTQLCKSDILYSKNHNIPYQYLTYLTKSCLSLQSAPPSNYSEIPQ